MFVGLRREEVVHSTVLVLLQHVLQSWYHLHFSITVFEINVTACCVLFVTVFSFAVQNWLERGDTQAQSKTPVLLCVSGSW